MTPTLIEAVEHEAEMVAAGWTATRHEAGCGSVFSQLQFMSEVVTQFYDDELEDPCDFKELAFALDEAVSKLSTSLGFPATFFTRAA